MRRLLIVLLLAAVPVKGMAQWDTASHRAPLLAPAAGTVLLVGGSLFTFVLFIVMLLVNYTSPQTLWLTVFALVSVVYMVILGLQWGKLFCSSPLDVIGLFVYMITVELLPAVLVYEAGRQLYFTYYS